MFISNLFSFPSCEILLITLLLYINTLWNFVDYSGAQIL